MSDAPAAAAARTQHSRSFTDAVAMPRGPAMNNRFMLAPLTNMQSNPDGSLGEDEYNWLTMRARGGYGLVMTCAAYVTACGKGAPGQLGVHCDGMIPGLARLAEGIRREGCLSSLQIGHSGHRSVPKLGGEPVGPVAVPESGARALTTGEIRRLRDAFVAAAVRAEKAGFHGVELHSAHGYLLCQFLDSANNRDDGYGGALEDRMRFLNDIIDGIRASTRSDFQLGVRLSPERYGITIEDARAAASALMTSGRIDYLDMSLWSVFKEPEDRAWAGWRLIDLFTGLPRGNTPLGVAGKIMDAATAQACIDAGADFVLVGRGAIIHHDFPRRAIADPAFASLPRPVPRAHLEAGAVGPRFMNYLEKGWPGFVEAA
ncbi:NADH:flavin oxidoreductase [Camelimonas abortus]|uniref:NADH:flavin oxidoreductase n=1 Tax=Camelimonas abortus TaxID=1017184 RepID=A0ABV7LE88_9HYPH